MESNYSTAILYLELYTLEKFLDMCTRGYVRMFTADCFLIEKQNNKFIKRRMNALWSICTYYTSKKKKKKNALQSHTTAQMSFRNNDQRKQKKYVQ